MASDFQSEIGPVRIRYGAYYAQLAQLVEQRVEVPRVFGSIPELSIIWGCSSAGRAFALQAEGREFNPLQLHYASVVK